MTLRWEKVWTTSVGVLPEPVTLHSTGKLRERQAARDAESKDQHPTSQEMLLNKEKNHWMLTVRSGLRTANEARS
jgi:hypothetical protein